MTWPTRVILAGTCLYLTAPTLLMPPAQITNKQNRGVNSLTTPPFVYLPALLYGVCVSIPHLFW